MVRIDHFPFKVQSFHGPVYLTHNVMRLALTPNSKVPLASFDWSSSVSLLYRCDSLATRFVSERSNTFRMWSWSVGLWPVQWAGRTSEWTSSKEFLEVIFFLCSLDPLVVNDQIVSNDQLVVRIITQQSSMDLLLLNAKLLTDLKQYRIAVSW